MKYWLSCATTTCTVAPMPTRTCSRLSRNVFSAASGFTWPTKAKYRSRVISCAPISASTRCWLRGTKTAACMCCTTAAHTAGRGCAWSIAATRGCSPVRTTPGRSAPMASSRPFHTHKATLQVLASMIRSTTCSGSRMYRAIAALSSPTSPMLRRRWLNISVAWPR